jgi:hypothetical protein
LLLLHSSPYLYNKTVYYLFSLYTSGEEQCWPGLLLACIDFTSLIIISHHHRSLFLFRCHIAWMYIHMYLYHPILSIPIALSPSFIFLFSCFSAICYFVLFFCSSLFLCFLLPFVSTHFLPFVSFKDFR